MIKRISLFLLFAAMMITPVMADTLYYWDECETSVGWVRQGYNLITAGAEYGYAGSGLGIAPGIGYGTNNRVYIIPPYATNLTYMSRVYTEPGTNAYLAVSVAGQSTYYGDQAQMELAYPHEVRTFVNGTNEWELHTVTLNGITPGNQGFYMQNNGNPYGANVVGSITGNVSYSIDDIKIYVKSGPLANFTASEPRVGGPGLQVSFTDCSTGSSDPDSWYWDFGDFHTSTVQNPTHTYNTAGVYDVSLTVSSIVDGAQTSKVEAGYVVVTGTNHPDTMPHFVQFKIVSAMGNAISDVNISAQFVESSSPANWFFEWFGLSGNINFENTTLKGISDSEGCVNFLMRQDIKYAVKFEKEGIIDMVKYYYPKDDRYVIITPNSDQGEVDWSADKPNWGKPVETGVSKNEETGGITAIYLDHLNKTESVQIVFYEKDKSGNITNLDTITITGQNDFNVTSVMSDYLGKSYFVSFKIVHTELGTIIKEFGLSFKQFVDIFGFTDRFGALTANWIYFMGSLFIIIFIGLCFDAFSTGQGMGLISATGWIMYGLGWLNPIGYSIVPALSLVSILAIIALIMQRKQQEGYT